MKYTHWPIGFFFLLMVPFATASACELDKKSTWYWSQEKLIRETKQILVAKLVSEEPTYDSSGMLKADLPLSGGSGGGQFTKWTFEVGEVLKGPKSKGSFFITSWKSLGKIIDRAGGSCAPVFSFEKGKVYLIFVDSYNPKGYQPRGKANDDLVEKIRGWSQFEEIIAAHGQPTEHTKKESDSEITAAEIASAPEVIADNLYQPCVDSNGHPQAMVYGTDVEKPYTLVVLEPKPERRFVVRLHHYGELTYRNKEVILSIGHDAMEASQGFPSHLLVRRQDGSQSDRKVFCGYSEVSRKRFHEHHGLPVVKPGNW